VNCSRDRAAGDTFVSSMFTSLQNLLAAQIFRYSRVCSDLERDDGLGERSRT
jgi:hypothetical protein